MSNAGIWHRARPYLGVRRNDEHTRYAFRFAEQLVSLCGARAEIVLPAIILHDTGWSTVPDDKILESFGPRLKYPEFRRRHEVEGARIAGDILRDLDYPPETVAAIAAIIDGHDSRAAVLSLEDAVVKDADKLWLFTPFGLDTVRGWFGYSASEYLTYLEGLGAARLHTEPGRHMARGLLVALRADPEPVAPS